jgi:thermostable 8-oxoguanine DNA glycosylase
LDAANYLSRFDNAKDFRGYVEKHIKEKRHVELIKTICEDPDTSVYGFGWPLACEFLKEIGYTDFIKMDSHLTAILEGLGVITATKGEEVYRQSIAFAESIEEKPFAVDKLFYLAGSGKVYLINYHNTETNDKKVIKFIKDRL